MMFSNMIVDITISLCSFVFSQSCVEVPASLSNVGGLAVGALDLVNRSLSVVRFIPDLMPRILDRSLGSHNNISLITS